MVRRSSINTVLLGLLIVCIGLNLIAARDFARPNLELLPDMVHSPRYDAYEPNPNFPDGKTLQAPVAGTIPRGQMPRHFAATPEDAVRAGRLLRNPYSLGEREVQQRGAAVFAAFCQHCHGPTGQGDGPVARRGFPPPPSLQADHAVKMKDGQMFHVITYGQGNMPAHGGQLSPPDRWKVIVHVRSLQSRVRQSTSKGATRP